MTVAAILRRKGRTVFAAPPTAKIRDVVHILAEHGIGALLVRDAAGQVLGIVSERDITRCLAKHGDRTLDLTAAQVMTQNVVIAAPDTTTHEALEMMTHGRFRHLPVMDGNQLCGLVSIGDVVKERISQQEQEVDSLKAYVAGTV